MSAKCLWESPLFLFWVKTGAIPALQGKTAEFCESLLGFLMR